MNECAAKLPSSIVIVGGGTAGWMCANLIKHYWPQVKITLIESSSIPTIGVGEGSTPYLRHFFQTLGIPEHEWMPACNATYKCGISFPNWRSNPSKSTTSVNNNYFHPFFSPFDAKTGEAFFNNADLCRNGVDADAHPNNFFVSATLSQLYKSPKSREELPFEIDYAYHFDSGLLGSFLRKHAIAQGVDHLIDTVGSVSLSVQGDIESLYLDKFGQFSADFFVDCTGFSGLLINKTLGVPFISYGDSLLNDSAVALPSAFDDGEDIPSETESCALKNGWAWKIPLANRYGNGYVYSSAFISADEAEHELRKHIGRALSEGHDARHIKMRVGRVKEHWRRNCLAVGLSQGFIEPLEATALMLIQITINQFVAFYEKLKGSERARKAYNERVNTYFDGVKDYVLGHYKLNARTDSEYWVANREITPISNSLRSIITAWDGERDFDKALEQYSTSQIYFRPSWYCLLAGMGRFPQVGVTSRKEVEQGAYIASGAEAKKYCQKIARGFYDHKAYLMELYGDKWPKQSEMV